MVLSRCSSAGLHGVFVLLFLGAGAGALVPMKVSPCSPTPAGPPRLAIGDDNDPVIVAAPGAFRFREGWELACGCGASMKSSCCGLKGI